MPPFLTGCGGHSRSVWTPFNCCFRTKNKVTTTTFFLPIRHAHPFLTSCPQLKPITDTSTGCTSGAVPPTPGQGQGWEMGVDEQIRVMIQQCNNPCCLSHVLERGWKTWSSTPRQVRVWESGQEHCGQQVVAMRMVGPEKNAASALAGTGRLRQLPIHQK